MISHSHYRVAAAAMALVLVVSAAACSSSSHRGSSAASTTGAANGTSTEHLVVTPADNAILLSTPVAATFRVPDGATLRIELNERVVPGPATPASVSLTQQDGLRYGSNTLFAEAMRNGQRVGVDSRTFTVSRPDTSAAQIEITPDTAARPSGQQAAPIHVQVTAASRPSATAASETVAFRDGSTELRAWINGREITSYFNVTRPGNWSADLSATHGLRPGTNQLRVLVVDLDRGVHADSTRTISLSANAPLAGAGRDQRTTVGARVIFSADTSALGTGSRGVRYRWQLVERPQGSHANLQAATTAHPWLTADRPGCYRARLTLSTGKAGTVASSDDAVADVVPGPLVDNVNTLAQDQAGHWGIQIGSAFYPNTSPGGDAMQALILDRTTLTPVATEPNGGNWYTDGTNNAAVGIPALHAHVGNFTPGQLVILAQPPTGHVPVQPGDPDLLGDWNQILSDLGASAFKSDQITAAQKSFSVIGVPFAEFGSAWQTATSSGTNATGPAALRGSFMDSAGDYAFSPQQVGFDTSASTGPGSNRISVDVPGAPFDGVLSPSTATSGLQVLALDNATLHPDLSASFALDGPQPQPDKDLGALHNALSKARSNGDLVFVQTIGNAVAPGNWPSATSTSPPPPPTHADQWNTVANDLTSLGASLPLVNAINGSYTLIGGAGLSPDGVVESSSAFPAPGQQPTPSRQRGYLTFDHSGRWHALLADPTGNGQLGRLYSVIHQTPQPWPLTQAGDPADQKAYQAAMADITDALGFDAYGTDIRAAYYLDDNFDFTTEKDDLAALTYQETQSYTAAQFATLKQQLSTEFDKLKQVKSLFDGWKEPFLRAQGGELVDLQTLGDDIKNDLNPPKGATFALDIVKSIIEGALQVVAPFAEKPLVDAANGALTTALELGSTVAERPGGLPLPDRIQGEVDDLSKTVATFYNSNAGAIDVLRDVVVSDYGKLLKMAAADKDPSWASSSTAISQAVPRLEVAALRMYYAHLFPLAFKTYSLVNDKDHTVPPPTSPDQCSKDTPFRGAPPSSWRLVTGSFKQATDTAAYKQVWILVPQILYAEQAPPQLTDPLVTPAGEQTRETNPANDREGVGFVLEQFMGRYLPAGGKEIVCID